MNTVMDAGAIFSPCTRYRYALWRIWNPDHPAVLFVGLNPSTADAQRNDPTIRRCIDFAQRWGYGGLYVSNLFAWRATQPNQLAHAPDPVGDETDNWLVILSQKSHRIIACWGNHGGLGQRDQFVSAILPALYCLAITKRGKPAHPLYLPKKLTPIPFTAPIGKTRIADDGH